MCVVRILLSTGVVVSEFYKTMGPNKKFVLGLVIVQIISVSCGVSAPRKAEEPENEVEKGLKMLYNVYQKCGETEDMFSCMKVKALRFADRALKINNIPIFEGMTVVRNEETTSRSLSVPEFNENELPQDPEKRQEALDDMLVDRVTRFLKTHSIQFDLPKVLDESKDSDVEEGRAKMKKMMGPLLMAAMMKGSMMAYALKAVGLLAAKALMVSKIALVIASIIGLKKLFSHGHSESKTIEIVQKPHISHAHTYSSGHDFGGFGGGGGGGGGGAGGWESSGHGHSGGGGYGRSLDGSVSPESSKTTVDELPVGKGVDNFLRRSFDTSVPFPQAQELAYRGQIPSKQQ